MKVSELFEVYDTSAKNRENFDDLKEWQKAVRQAGADYDKKTDRRIVATGYDGTCGEFDTVENSGWLIDKWASKPVKEGINGEMRQVYNRQGQEKKFKWIDGDWQSPAAVKAYMYSNEYVQPGGARKSEFEKRLDQREKEDNAIARQKAKELRGLKNDTQLIWRKVEDVISNSFPDGDPIDSLGPWMEKNGLDMTDVDRAAKKHSGSKGGFYGYLADMWDDFAADALHDAKQEYATDGKFESSPFIDKDKNGAPIRSSNPWKAN